MQAIICGLLVLVSALFVVNRWLPSGIKQRFMQRILKRTPLGGTTSSAGGCSNCSSCGNCGSDSKKIIQKVVF